MLRDCYATFVSTRGATGSPLKNRPDRISSLWANDSGFYNACEKVLKNEAVYMVCVPFEETLVLTHISEPEGDYIVAVNSTMSEAQDDAVRKFPWAETVGFQVYMVEEEDY